LSFAELEEFVFVGDAAAGDNRLSEKISAADVSPARYAAAALRDDNRILLT